VPDEAQPEDGRGAAASDETQQVGPDLTKPLPSGPPEPPPAPASPYGTANPWTGPRQWGQPPQQPYGAPQPYGQPYGAPPAYGQYWTPSSPYGAAPTTSGKATAVLVLGIASLLLLFMCGLGLVTAIVALVMAPGAKREIQDSAGRLTGLGMVQGGVVCSWIALGLLVLFVAVMIFVMVVGGSMAGDFSTVGFVTPTS
jgi:hypothetical protein